MELVRYTDARLFCDRVLPFLLQHEAENNLMIGIALRLADGTGMWGDEPPLLCAIEVGGQVVAAALQTPPYHLQLTRMDEAMMTALVAYLRAVGHVLPGVLGPEASVDAFATLWTAGTRTVMQHEQGMGVYQLDRVLPPAPVGGHAEFATQADTELLIEWIREFHRFIGEERGSAEAAVAQALERQSYQLWKNPHPVSLAGCTSPTPHGIRVGPVYTPSEHRGKGYASANVAALSQHLLNTGRKFCYLFTDLANPTSNKIYQKIGYCQVCDFASYRFVGETECT